MQYKTLLQCLAELDERLMVRPTGAIHWLIGCHQVLSVAQARELVKQAGLQDRLAMVSVGRSPTVCADGVYGVGPDEYIWGLFLFSV